MMRSCFGKSSEQLTQHTCSMSSAINDCLDKFLGESETKALSRAIQFLSESEEVNQRYPIK
jgi:hypothetical protein